MQQTVGDIVALAQRPCRLCGKSEPRLFRMYDKGGRRHDLRAWCRSCGACLTGVIPEQKAIAVSVSMFCQITSCDQAESARWHAWAERRRDALQANRDAQWRKKYDDYMQSEAWRQRRQAVLRRDDYICQSCLSANAVQVHHLSYDHLGAEPLWDLISVCVTCHDAIHKRNDARMPIPGAMSYVPDVSSAEPF